jgi:hypothetical protein
MPRRENQSKILELQKDLLEWSQLTTPLEPEMAQLKLKEKEKENNMLQLMLRQYESTLGMKGRLIQI